MKTTKAIKAKSTKATKPKAKPVAVASAPVVKTKAKTPPAKAVKVVKASAPKPAPAAAPASAPRITAELIARHAYFIWEQQGRPAGKEREHWLLAEQQLHAA